MIVPSLAKVLEVKEYLVFAILCYVVINHPLATLGCNVRVLNHPDIGFCVPHFFVCTHDYEHIDMFAIRAEIERWHQLTGRYTRIVVANLIHNKMYDALLPKRGSCLFVTHGTTRKILTALSCDNVCIFLYRDSTGTGIHHVLSEHRGPVRLVKIRSSVPTIKNHDVVYGIKRCNGNQYTLEYAPYDARAHRQCDASAGMSRVKDALYGAA